MTAHPSTYRDLALSGQPVRGVRIIDVHGHMGDWCGVRVFGSSAEEMVARMDALGIEAVCVSAFLSINGNWRAGNDKVGAAIARYPGRFIGYATINPHYPETIEAELTRCFDQLGMRGLKFHPAWHDYPPEGSAYLRAIAFAAERGAAILNHTWGTPAHLEKLAGQFPRVTFIVGHQANHVDREVRPDSWARVIRDYPNVYADLALSTALLDGFDRLVEAVGPGKILYGSDTPLHDMGFQLGRVLLARIAESDKTRILGANAAEILNLFPPKPAGRG